MSHPPLTYREIANERLLKSLIRKLRSLREKPLRIETTAKPDPAVLDRLIETRSPLASIVEQARAIFEDRRRPAEAAITAAPVDVPPIWSDQRRGLPAAVSVGAHTLVALIVFWGFQTRAEPPAAVAETWVPLYLPADLMLPVQDEETSGGGGGGGKETLMAPSLGQPPRAADRQLTPPAAEPPKNPDPILAVEPTIVAPQLAEVLPVTPLDLGDPDGIPAPPSSGPGIGGGIGTGQGRGVGEGDGPGLGPGEGGGYGGGVFRIGGGITPPTVRYREDPIYTDQARKAQHQGIVVLEAIVRRDGSVDIVRVVRSLGYGLDENAMEALRHWKFNPAMRNGEPVDVALNIEVRFNLR